MATVEAHPPPASFVRDTHAYLTLRTEVIRTLWQYDHENATSSIPEPYMGFEPTFSQPDFMKPWTSALM